MFVTIINDCTDANVIGRQGTRVAALFGVSPTYVGVGAGLQSDNSADPAELEAAGCLIDALDAAGDEQGVVLVNVANRHAKGKKWPNGTPFGYFHYKNILVVSTVDGIVLSLVNKLGIVDSIYVMDIPTVMKELVAVGLVTETLSDHIQHSQFRSFDFSPRVAKFLFDGRDIPAEQMNLVEIEELPKAVWYIDNFGNCKTTILKSDVEIDVEGMIETKLGKLKFFSRLKDVPNNGSGIIVGSSGINDNRFLEIVVQGVHAARHFKLTVGSVVL